MKTLFQIFVILAVATLIGGLMFASVNASSPALADGQDTVSVEQVNPETDGDAFRPESEDRDEGGISGFPAGVIKALVLMSISGGVYSAVANAGKKAKRTVSA
ncbi:MAG: hypothetical protein HZB18_14440 [Chloroflexi bacterium]|nr:hypothetical protein [Chloroflexota bacterium]